MAQRSQQQVNSKLVPSGIIARALDVIGRIQLKLISKQYWVDLVDNLFHLSNQVLERLLLRICHFRNNIFSPNLDKNFEDVNVIDELGET